MLTPRQKQIKDFIDKVILKKNIAPTEREIAARFKISPSTAHEHLETLQEKGYLEKARGRARGIKISDSLSGLINIPLLGYISAGNPIEAIEDRTQMIAIPARYAPTTASLFALEVQGDSMIEEDIHDGDVIVVNQQNTAKDGETVVALIDNEFATVKKIYRERRQIRLQPANDSFEPIIIKRNQDIKIQGVVVDVIKTRDAEQPTQDFVLPISKRDTGQQKTKPYFEDSGFSLYHGNCLDILSQLPANSIDMIFADPPYNLSNNGFSLHAGKRVSVNKGEWDKSKGFKDDYDFHHKWLDACKRVLKPEGSLWVSGTYHSIYQCGHALQSLGYHILNDISWFKPNGSPNLSCRYFTASHENLIWARKDKSSKHIFNYSLMKNGHWPEDFIKKPNLQMRSVWAIYPPKKSEKEFGKHPTQKPIELLKRIILASTKPNAVILDPFTGSSTTGIASKIIGKRKFIGIDTEREFLDVSIKRFKELSKK